MNLGEFLAALQAGLVRCFWMVTTLLSLLW